MDIRIKPLKIADYDAVLGLWKSSPGVGLSAADEKPALKTFLKMNRTTCFAAWDQDRIVGTVLCGSDGRRGYIYHLLVVEDCRGQGLGRRLLDLCLEGLTRKGVDKAHLFVMEDNHGARAFYSKAGWKFRDDIVVFSSDTRDCCARGTGVQTCETSC